MLVRLTDGWREVLRRRAEANDVFPAPVRHLVGEMAAAATLMQANIKFNGALILQVYGDRREPLQKLSDVLEHYMLQSEQLDTKLILAADDEVAAGLLIQRLPVEGAGNLGSARNEDEIGRNEDYNRIAHLAATLTPDELLRLSPDTVLHRLFWEEPLQRFEPLVGARGPRFACSCSRERVGQMLRSLGRDEIDSIVAEQGRVEIACDFCG